MASLFSPDTPKPDRGIQRLQEAEQRRADLERQRQLQLQLAQETARRRGLGLRSLFDSGGLGSLIGSG